MITLELALPMIRNNSKMYGGTIHQLRDEIESTYGFDFDVSELLFPETVLNGLSMQEFREYYKIGFENPIHWNRFNGARYTFNHLLGDYKFPENTFSRKGRDAFLAHFIGYMDGLLCIIPTERVG